MRKKLLLLSLIIGVMMTACSDSIHQGEESAKLLETDNAFAARSLAIGYANAFREFLAEDALMLSDGNHPTTGRENIFESMSKSSPENVLTWKPQRAEVSKAGDMGWTWGTFEFRVMEADTIKSVSHGKYLNVWQKEPDGNWRVAVDMGNASPAPE